MKIHPNNFSQSGNTANHKLFSLIEILVIFILPILFSETIPGLYLLRTYFLIVIVCYFLYVGYKLHMTPMSVGITTANLRNSLKAFLLPGFLATVFLVAIFVKLPGMLMIKDWEAQLRQTSIVFWIVSYALITAPLQEMLYRGFLLFRLESITGNKLLVILVSSILFSCAHLPFHNATFILLTFVFGMWMGFNYLKYRTILTPIIAHAVFGGILLFENYLILK